MTYLFSGMSLIVILAVLFKEGAYVGIRTLGSGGGRRSKGLD
jgi:hypothetical protein